MGTNREPSPFRPNGFFGDRGLTSEVRGFTSPPWFKLPITLEIVGLGWWWMPCEVARRVGRSFGTFFDPVAQRRVVLNRHDAIYRNRINGLDGQISAASLDNASMRRVAP